MNFPRRLAWLLAVYLASSFCQVSHAKETEAPAAEGKGTIRGKVILATTGVPIHGAEVFVVGMGVTVFADVGGSFALENVPVGPQELLAFRQHLNSERVTVEVEADKVTDLEIAMTLTPVHESITVTASVGETTTFESFTTVTSLDSMDIAEKMAVNIGELLEEEPGVSKRTFGPGSSRPIIRGFDGDRVLIMQDGIRTGDLSSQSGDHGVTIDPASLERLEVVRGPATLLYGSNAIGGVVNAVTPHDTFYHAKHVGTDGQAGGDLGSANEQAGFNGSVQHTQESWSLWAGGGARRSGDYDTPEGKVDNSKTRLSTGRAGFGYFTDRTSFSFGYQIEDGLYGVPGIGALHAHEREGEEREGEEELEEEELQVDLDSRRQSARFDVGMRSLENRFVDSFRVVFNYLDWHHDELEYIDGSQNLGTSFDNGVYVGRAELEQKKTDRLSGKFGVWTTFRDYVVTGDEALAPPTTQTAFAGFVYEEVALSPAARIQFGGRIEYNKYDPEQRSAGHGHEEEGEEHLEGELEPPEVRPRSFTGFSGSVGYRHDIGSASAFVSNFTVSSRAPALEELYNYGPHVGNLAFEIGNPDLEKERSIGIDVGLRSQARRVSGGVSVYYYDISNFVFAAFTNVIADGLRVAPFLQDDSRFVGADAEVSFELHEHAFLNLDVGYVDAKLTARDEYLPRIPPLHGRIAVEIPYGGLTVRPELVLAAEQDKVSINETPTDGYAVFNINVSYLLARQNLAHTFSVRAYNLTNELYRLHTSFIKNIAPETGRGILFNYSIRFF